MMEHMAAAKRDNYRHMVNCGKEPSKEMRIFGTSCLAERIFFSILNLPDCQNKFVSVGCCFFVGQFSASVDVIAGRAEMLH